MESIAHATNVMLHGKKVVVIGYGYCGSGVAQRFRGMGAHVTVVDTNPLTRLEAHLEGFYTADLVKTLTDADFVVSVVGRDNVLTGEHFSLMKDQVIIANAGHFQREVDVPALLALSDSREEIVPKITSYRLKSGKQLFLISDANLVNLSAGNGNPIEVMDLGLALQTLSLERIALDSKSLRAIPQPVPFDIEMNVAELACNHWINH